MLARPLALCLFLAFPFIAAACASSVSVSAPTPTSPTHLPVSPTSIATFDPDCPANSPGDPPWICRKGLVTQSPCPPGTSRRHSGPAVCVPHTATPPPFEPFSLLPTELADQDLSRYIDAWTLYQNPQFGVQFEYPLIYRDAPACGITEYVNEEGALEVTMGSRIIAIVDKAGDLQIEDYIDHLMAGSENVEIYATPIAGRSGYLIYGRFGGLGRLEEIYVVDLGEIRVSLGLTPPWVCDFPEVGIREPDAFERLAATISTIP